MREKKELLCNNVSRCALPFCNNEKWIELDERVSEPERERERERERESCVEKSLAVVRPSSVVVVNAQNRKEKKNEEKKKNVAKNMCLFVEH